MFNGQLCPYCGEWRFLVSLHVQYSNLRRVSDRSRLTGFLQEKQRFFVIISIKNVSLFPPKSPSGETFFIYMFDSQIDSSDEASF